jgi:dipeptidyl-peptidase-4
MSLVTSPSPNSTRFPAHGATWLVWVACLTLVVGPTSLLGAPLQEKKKEAEKEAERKASEVDELTLEKLFPEKSLFGPSASRPAFSSDGRYAAYLYRPYIERRHGSDLYLYDFETGETRRLTRVSVMAEFHDSVRKVKEDRVKKAMAEKKKDEDATSEKKDSNKPAKEDSKKSEKPKQDKSKSKKQDEQKDSDDLSDWVSEKDADDEKAPRYTGISSFIWSPVANEMLVSSQGDIFRLKLDGKDASLKRLTRTTESERSVRFLPDGQGYTYMADDRLYRVRFNDSFVEQIDPKLPSGHTMRDYELSPDGERLVLVSTQGDAPFSSERKIKIVNYRNRFAEVREFTRVVADDPKKKQDIYVHFYDLSGHRDESSELVEVHHHQLTGPRDVFSTPQWSLDSSKVVFAKFDQASAQVHVLTASFPSKASGDEAKSETSKEEAAKSEDEGTKKKGLAKIVYRYLHDGGPNTPRMLEPQFIQDHQTIVLLTEQTGFRHVYLLDPLYETLTPLTQGSFEVYPEELSEDRTSLLVTSTKEDPSRAQVYRVDFESQEMVPLSQEPGSYSGVAMSADGQRLLANYVTFGKGAELVRVDLGAKKNKQVTLTDSHPESTLKLIQPVPELFSYENRHGHRIHGHMFKPDDWKKGDKRPLLIYVYGGPLGTRKMVVDGSYASDSYFFGYYMAKKHGYVTVTIDPRGVSGYGGLFEKSNFEQIGRPQVDDLTDGVKYLVNELGVDPNKVGIHGWSFGGFQTQMCLYLEPSVFQVGIAGAGPTEWENYNAWYTTGTVSNSREGETDQGEYSLLKLAKNLEGKLLLIHGMEDSNVLYQDTVRVYRELLKAGKETLVELFLDPTGGHSLGGDVKRLGRFKKYEEYLTRNLGSRPPKQAARGKEKPTGGKAKK